MNDKLSRPTDAELAILRVLWQRGPSTVRAVHEVIQPVRGTSYTTTLKLMQIMDEKGFVRRDKSRRQHVYEALLQEGQVQRQLVDDLLERAFEGSASKLVLQALSTQKMSAAELAQIRELLNDMEVNRDEHH